MMRAGSGRRYVDGEKSIDKLEQARTHDRGHHQSYHQVTFKLRSLAGLMGEPVAAAFVTDVESLQEHHGEAAWNYERVLEEYHAELVKEREVRAAESLELVRVREQLAVAVGVTKQRHARSRRPLPEWVGDAEELLFVDAEIVDDGEPF